MSVHYDEGKYQVFATTDGRWSSGASRKRSTARAASGQKGRGDSSAFGDLSSSSFIFRHKLVDGLASSLERDGLVVLCAEYGLGRHVLVRQLESVARDRGAMATELKLSGLCPETICRKVRVALKEASEISRDGGYALVVIDGLGILDDPILGRLARAVSNAVLSGCKVVILLDPDCESMLEFLPTCHVVRASDLLLDMSEYPAWETQFGGFSPIDAKRCTHGIVSLLAVLRAVRCLPDGTPHGSAWDRVVGELLFHALRPGLIEEELSIRCGMAALGHGDVRELEHLGIRVSHDILREIAASAPIFGVDLQAGSFELVPCEPGVVATALAALPPKYENMASSSVRLLAEQGRVCRASAIASALSSTDGLRMLAAEFPLEMIDAGQSKSLMRMVFSDDDAADLMPARRMLKGLGIVHSVPVGISDECRSFLHEGEGMALSCSSTRVSLHVKLVEALKEVKRTGVFSIDEREDARIAAIGGASAMRLLARGRELELRLQGRSLEAFRELLVGRELREQHGETSVFAAVLATDFESLRVLVGDPESSGDQMRLTKAREVLEEFAPMPMRVEAESILALVSVVSGVSCSLSSAERFSTTQECAGNSSLMAWINLSVAVANLCSGSYRNAYVRARAASAEAEASLLVDVALAADMVKSAALVALGENPLLEDGARSNRDCVAGEPEPSADLVLLNQLYKAMWDDDPEAKASAVAAMRGLVPRVEVMAFASCLVRSDRAHGSLLADALPLSWRPRRMLPQVLSDSVQAVGCRCGAERSARGFDPQGDVPLLEVDVMGGFGARRGGIRISEREWRRRRSRDLMSMLALTPGHMLARHDAINQLWQDADPIRGRESLYSVLSSLRSTIGQNLPELKYVVGEQGKIWLDESLVICDIDEFERVARQVMGRRIPDDEAVSLCLRMEGMYGNGSYLPASDVDGRYRRRHEELSMRFIDAMLTGADAARRLRDERQAQWFLETARVERGNCPEIIRA